MVFKVYNTMTRRKEEFKPLHDNEARVYNCGPTVYAPAHVGNLRAYVFADVLRRYLEFKGYRVKQVMNITDVDDKTIKGSREKKKPLKEYTKKFEQAFFDDLQKMNILPATFYPHATDHVNEMAAAVQKLLDKGFAYKGDDASVYFSIKKFKNYGKLAHLKADELKTGASGVKSDEYDKADARDFVLWKAWEKSDGDVYWNTSLGKGRPGWHLECSVMSAKYLGQPFDIHTGGVDLVFPHHENEIAQAEAAEGTRFVKYWMHNEHLMVDGKKMSKSLKNFYTLADVEKKGYSPIALRFLFASTHYRSQLNLTWESLEAAEKTVQKLNEFAAALSTVAKEKNGLPANREVLNAIATGEQKFEEKMDDDLDVSSALAAFFAFEKLTGKALADKTLDSATAAKAFDFVRKADVVFGFLRKEESQEVTSEEQSLIIDREKAKKTKDFKTADKIRGELAKNGVFLEDTPEGVKWKVKRK